MKGFKLSVGRCPRLRVFPSPTGKLLAVVILDDADIKARRTSTTDDDWTKYPSNHTVVFLETKPLLESGKMVVRGKTKGQSIAVPAGQFFIYSCKFRWSKKEDYFVLFDIDNGNKFVKFSTNSTVVSDPKLESCQGNPICDCPFAAPTESSEYRYPDGLMAADLTNKSPTNAFNCGKV